MKVIAFNGSPRRDGNTSILLHHVLEPIKAKGIETEVYQLGGTNIHGCRGCYACIQKKNGHCVHDDDVANECITKMIEADTTPIPAGEPDNVPPGRDPVVTPKVVAPSSGPRPEVPELGWLPGDIGAGVEGVFCFHRGELGFLVGT